MTILWVSLIQISRIEKVGSWIIGISLGILGIAAQVTGLIDLANHNIPDSSDASLIISAVCLVIMVLIWYPTNTLAHVLHSSTLEGEAKCSLTCIQMTLVLFIGSLIVRVSEGGWWVNSVTTMLLGRLFEFEAWKTIKWVRDPNFDGGCCGGHDGSHSHDSSIMLYLKKSKEFSKKLFSKKKQDASQPN